MLRTVIKGSIVSIGLASALLGSQITIQNGWNLLGTGYENVVLNNKFSAHPEVSLVWGYTNDTKQWLAYGNSAVTAQVLVDNNISKLEFVPSHVGYWVLNNGSAFTIDTPDGNVSSGDNNNTNNDQNNSNSSQQKSIDINVTYGAALTGKTLSSFLVDGTTFFEIEGHEYIKNSVSGSSITSEWYKDVNGSLTLEETENINVSTVNGTYTLTDIGEKGTISLDSVSQIETVNGVIVTGMQSLKVTAVVTQQATIQKWYKSSWTPKYFDETLNQNIPVTDVVKLKNNYIKGNWFGNNDNKQMFAASSDTSVTSGDVMLAAATGTQQNCTPSSDYDCKIYSPSSTKVGTWNLTNDILTVDTNASVNAWQFNNGIFEESWIDKVGTSHQMEWITGGTDTAVNSAIESTILSSYK